MTHHDHPASDRPSVRIEFTKELPTEDGDYIVRHRNGFRRVVTIHSSPEGLRDRADVLVSSYEECQFCGPLIEGEPRAPSPLPDRAAAEVVAIIGALNKARSDLSTRYAETRTDGSCADDAYCQGQYRGFTDAVKIVAKFVGEPLAPPPVGVPVSVIKEFTKGTWRDGPYVIGGWQAFEDLSAATCAAECSAITSLAEQVADKTGERVRVSRESLEAELAEARRQLCEADAANSRMRSALEQVRYFWDKDPEAFGDRATLGTLAVQFSKLAEECDAALALDSEVTQESLCRTNWYPPICPITQRPFFMWIPDESGKNVPTYGGPFDSYTIPEFQRKQGEPWHEGELFYQRYDHDEGGWVDGGEVIDLHLIGNKALMDFIEATEELAEIRSKSPLAEKPGDLAGEVAKLGPVWNAINNAQWAGDFIDPPVSFWMVKLSQSDRESFICKFADLVELDSPRGPPARSPPSPSAKAPPAAGGEVPKPDPEMVKASLDAVKRGDYVTAEQYIAGRKPSLSADAGKEVLRPSPNNGMVGWPESWTDRRYNASNEPCDMLVGHCACGAMHNAGEDWVKDKLKIHNATIASPSLPADVEGALGAVERIMRWLSETKLTLDIGNAEIVDAHKHAWPRIVAGYRAALASPQPLGLPSVDEIEQTIADALAEGTFTDCAEEVLALFSSKRGEVRPTAEQLKTVGTGQPTGLDDPEERPWDSPPPLVAGVPVERERDAEKRRVTELANDVALRDSECRALKQDAIRAREILVANNYWTWQGDGTDHPESLVCQVVMTADQLRGLISLADAQRSRADSLEAALSAKSTEADQLAERLREVEDELSEAQFYIAGLLGDCKQDESRIAALKQVEKELTGLKDGERSNEQGSANAN